MSENTEAGRVEAEMTEAERNANYRARLLPKNSPYELPAIEVAGAQVYVYVHGGRLIVSVDLDGADPMICHDRDQDQVRLTVRVQGEPIFKS